MFVEQFLTPKGRPMALTPLAGEGSFSNLALSILPDCENEPYKFMRTFSGASTAVDEQEASEWQLICPKGPPVALTPLCTPTSRPDNALSLLPDPDAEPYKFARTLSGASTAADPNEWQPFGAPDDVDLQSPLGRWAARAVRADSLESELGQWAENAVRAEAAAKRRLSLPTGVVGVWSDLLEFGAEAVRDGPALTADGRALDLDGGRAIWFSHEAWLAEGARRKFELKAAARLIRDVRVAHAACEAEAHIETGQVCPIDASGILQGGFPMLSPQALSSTPIRWKLFHQKLRARRATSCRRAPPTAVLCAGPDCRVFLHLALESAAAKQQRLQNKRAALARRAEKICGHEVTVMDMYGLVHF